MKDNAALAVGWVRKAESDLADARRTANSDGPYDTACFHAQQAVEKYLKALLAWQGIPIPRTHDLEELQRLCQPLIPMDAFSGLNVAELSGYAVELRYDAEFWPDLDTAVAALAIADTVRALVLGLLPVETTR